MGQRHFGDIAVEVGFLGDPVAKARTETMRDGGDLHIAANLGECHVGQRLARSDSGKNQIAARFAIGVRAGDRIH